MSPEVWSAIFAGGTFVVIAASAIAALIQLRHLRASNQLSGMITINNLWHDPRIQAWFDFVRDDLPSKLEDPEFRRGILAQRIDRRVHVELYAADFWEQIGGYVKYRLIDEASFLDLACQQVVEFWEMLWPVTSARRVRGGPSVYENFEYLAVLAKRWIARHPTGAYPNGLARMSDLDPTLSPQPPETQVAGKNAGV